MKKRFIVLATCILLVLLFSGSAVAADSFLNPVLAPGDMHDLTISKSAGGTASGAGTFPEGDTVTVIATPAAGYTFVGWTGTGVPDSTSATYAFEMPASNCSLYAEFAPVLHDLTISTSPGGTASGAGSFAAGTEVTVSATPSSGYDFIRWEASGSTVSTSAVYKFSMPTSAYSLNAVFAAKPATPTPTPTPKPATPTPTPTPKPATPTPKVTPAETAAPTLITEPTAVPTETTETTVAPTETTAPAETTAPTATPTPTPAAAAAKTSSDSGGNSRKGFGLIVFIGAVLFMAIGATIAGFIEEYKGRKKIVVKKSADNPTNNYRF